MLRRSDIRLAKCFVASSAANALVILGVGYARSFAAHPPVEQVLNPVKIASYKQRPFPKTGPNTPKTADKSALAKNSKAAGSKTSGKLPANPSSEATRLVKTDADTSALPSSQSGTPASSNFDAHRLLSRLTPPRSPGIALPRLKATDSQKGSSTESARGRASDGVGQPVHSNVGTSKVEKDHIAGSTNAKGEPRESTAPRRPRLARSFGTPTDAGNHRTSDNRGERGQASQQDDTTNNGTANGGAQKSQDTTGAASQGAPNGRNKPVDSRYADRRFDHDATGVPKVGGAPSMGEAAQANRSKAPNASDAASKPNGKTPDNGRSNSNSSTGTGPLGKTSASNDSSRENEAAATETSERVPTKTASAPRTPAKPSPQATPKPALASKLTPKPWELKPGQRLVLPKSIDPKLLEQMANMPAAPVTLSAAQREQVRKMLEGQPLIRVKVDKSLLAKLVENAKKAQDDAPPSAPDDWVPDEEKKNVPRTPKPPRKNPQANSESRKPLQVAKLPTDTDSPFRYRPWSASFTRRYENLALDSSEDERKNVAMAPGTDPAQPTPAPASESTAENDRKAGPSNSAPIGGNGATEGRPRQGNSNGAVGGTGDGRLGQGNGGPVGGTAGNGGRPGQGNNGPIGGSGQGNGIGPVGGTSGTGGSAGNGGRPGQGNGAVGGTGSSGRPGQGGGAVGGAGSSGRPGQGNGAVGSTGETGGSGQGNGTVGGTGGNGGTSGRPGQGNGAVGGTGGRPGQGNGAIGGTGGSGGRPGQGTGAIGGNGGTGSGGGTGGSAGNGGRPGQGNGIGAVGGTGGGGQGGAGGLGGGGTGGGTGIDTGGMEAGFDIDAGLLEGEGGYETTDAGMDEGKRARADGRLNKGDLANVTTTSEPQTPDLPPHNHHLQKGIPGALVLPPLPPLGTEAALGLDPKPIERSLQKRVLVVETKPVVVPDQRPAKRQTVARPEPAPILRVPAKTLLRQVMTPRVSASRPAPKGAPEVTVALLLGSASERGTVAVDLDERARLPLGTVTDSIAKTEQLGQPFVVPPMQATPTTSKRRVQPAPKRPITAKLERAILTRKAIKEAQAAPTPQAPALAQQARPASHVLNSRGTEQGSINPLPPIPLPDSDSEIGDGSGLKGEYYLGTNFDQYQFTRADRNLDLFWGGDASPNSKLPPGGSWSARWTGKLQPRFSEEYTLYAVADDGVRVWLDGVLVIDHWAWAPRLLEYAVKLPLNKNKQYDLRVDFFQTNGPAAIGLYWESKSQEKEFVPQECLFYPLPEPDGQVRQYELPR